MDVIWLLVFITGCKVADATIPTISGITTEGNVVSFQQPMGPFNHLSSSNNTPSVFKITNFTGINGLFTFTWNNGHLTEFPDFRASSQLSLRISINNNLISYINPAYLEHINKLYLNNNSITHFPATTIPMNLVILELDGNPITAMPDFGTISLQLTSLSLQRTWITEISSSLKPFPQLTTINLRDCRLTNPPPCNLFPASLSFVDIGGNPLKSFDPVGMDLTCVDLSVGFIGADFTTIPNFCRQPVLPMISWAGPDANDYINLHCDCTALLIKVNHTMYLYAHI